MEFDELDVRIWGSLRAMINSNFQKVKNEVESVIQRVTTAESTVNSVVQEITVTPDANKISRRDSGGMLQANSLKTTVANDETTIPATAALAVRPNNTNDAALRFFNLAKVKEWLNIGTTDASVDTVPKRDSGGFLNSIGFRMTAANNTTGLDEDAGMVMRPDVSVADEGNKFKSIAINDFRKLYKVPFYWSSGWFECVELTEYEFWVPSGVTVGIAVFGSWDADWDGASTLIGSQWTFRTLLSTYTWIDGVRYVKGYFRVHSGWLSTHRYAHFGLSITDVNET